MQFYNSFVLCINHLLQSLVTRSNLRPQPGKMNMLQHLSESKEQKNQWERETELLFKPNLFWIAELTDLNRTKPKSKLF